MKVTKIKLHDLQKIEFIEMTFETRSETCTTLLEYYVKVDVTKC